MRKERFFTALMLAAFLSLAGAASAMVLVPGGQSIGVAISTGGLVVTGFADVGDVPSPGRLAGIRIGDVVTHVDGEIVTDAAGLSAMLSGARCDVRFERDGEVFEAGIVPAFDEKAQAYRLGIFVKQGTAGIGTMTYFDPETGDYGALGHAITDEDSGIVLPAADGAIYENSIINVEKGREGAPGEIVGQFYDGGYMGNVEKNTVSGVFGRLNAPPEEVLFPEGIDVGAPEDVREGKAEIITTVDGQGLKEFECEIVRIHDRNESPDKSFTVRITDDELLGITGGIVQGMSGSPIIQDGKLIGAVTHVLVNDPSRGYGIFIENMLDAAA